MRFPICGRSFDPDAAWRHPIAWPHDDSFSTRRPSSTDTRRGAAVREAGFEVVHHLYPAAVLGHRFDGLPRWLGERPQGVFAIEPHLARGDCGAKFESILVVDGDETRWLDPGLFGDVEG
jgi:hypothetical protein